MAQQTINIGSAPNDGAGDPLRTAFQKCNDNFTELYSAEDTPDALQRIKDCWDVEDYNRLLGL